MKLKLVVPSAARAADQGNKIDEADREAGKVKINKAGAETTNPDS